MTSPEADPKRIENGTEKSTADLDSKFWIAMALFALLAGLVWFTMGEGTVLAFGKPVQLRMLPLIVIGGLALRAVLARSAEKIRRPGEKN